MDSRTNLLYQINLAIFLFFTYCRPSASAPVNTMLDAIVACDSVKFLRNSSYVNQCRSLPYAAELTVDQPNTEINFMCMTLNHITKKICEYYISDNSQIKLPQTAEKFDEEIKSLEPRHDDIVMVVDSWCQNMTAIVNASVQNDTNTSYRKYTNEILDKIECLATCHIHGGVNHFCSVFFWFNKLYDKLQSSKKLNISKEAVASKQESLHKAEENVEKQLIKKVTTDEHTNVVNTNIDKEQPKQQQLPEKDVPNNSKAESLPDPNESEINKILEQSEIPDGEQQRQDSKLPLSTDDKTNIVESKIENPKAEIQEGNNGFLDEEGKKLFDDGADGESDHNIMETNKKDSFNDPGDQRSIINLPAIKEEDESHFFIYFSIISFVCVTLYIGYHNKQKILAMVLEGRQSRRSRSNRRRPNTANYRKLDSNLEEAVTSQCNSNVTHVIY